MLSQHVLTLTILLFFLVCFCHSLHDRLTSVTPLYPGDKLVSDNGGMFALGFFNLTTVNSTRSLYLGIWLWTNYRAHTAVRVVAWKGPRDPSAGEFSLSGDPGSRGLQIVIWRGTGTGTAGGRSWRSGVWNGAGAFSSINRFVYSQVVDDGGTIYAAYNAAGGPTTHWKLDHTGNVSLRVWNVESSSWSVLFEGPGTGCLRYGACGPFGYCEATGRDGGVQECKCLDGFEPEDGFFRDFSRGRHYFLALPGMKVPDKFLYVRNRSFEECAAECDRNCSCTAYAYANLSGIVTMSATSDVSRCLLWMGELVDTGKDSDLGENLYLRLAGSPGNNNKKKIGSMAMEIVLPVMACLLMLTSCVCLVTICKSRARTRRWNKEAHERSVHGFWDQNPELSCTSFAELKAATNSFHEANLLGQGGFGKVYKGTLEDGREVAVKRLSNGSEQGKEQLRNELVLIASLQHKNLVRLLGCCIHEDEKLLIYEYLPNKSLDKFLFDPALKSMLDWPKRFNIIKGVARGILYLHQDSRMAWNLWKDGTAREFVDATVVDVESRCSLDEALQCIHIGLLCVQDSPNDRPLMSLVVSMLNNEAAPRPVPSQPLFFAQRYHEALATRADYSEHSANHVSLSMLQGR
ncbi:G-type lectin S-receptor-like serine/threonine-protein kinase B120 [Zea mays]|uniref:non-specific serine/threonine protein kinase n=1 Tax=Zea mays TaxID=4577 RepID=A0A3L6DDA9_MAIZE|nr:G-type lectin S-receptor-like serine/threonine-protein kinase B120 [Zea mays]